MLSAPIIELSLDADVTEERMLLEQDVFGNLLLMLLLPLTDEGNKAAAGIASSPSRDSSWE
jgi:hypothetical protein